MYLLQHLNKSVLDSVGKNETARLSVLESKDEGDYLPGGEKKDHPHFSNTVKLTELPNERLKGFLPQVLKKREMAFSSEDNCVLKIKQFMKFVSLLFEMGNE